MRKKYYHHWFLFVFGLHIFLQPEISDEDFRLAKKAFNKFVNLIEPLYGKKFMKFNVHLLTHIPQSWGTRRRGRRDVVVRFSRRTIHATIAIRDSGAARNES